MQEINPPPPKTPVSDGFLSYQDNPGYMA